MIFSAWQRSRMTVIEPCNDFWRQVEPTGFCWNWTGRRTHNGYGDFREGGVRTRAHRYAYEMLVGPIPEGLVLDHLCRNRLCVNPDHLEPVTIGENVLRGMGPTSIAFRRGECVKGHSVDETTGYLRSNGRYECRACSHRRQQEKPKKPPRPQRTECLQGHPFDEVNTYVTPDGKRRCRACHRMSARRYREGQVA
ncbi:HNH endonuclease signature motif containing protein [Streptomyces sp. NPDC096033]|uniref:HNH endonuclease signature motif containing protein n=1 Tax=Streptomyces sp. NPDC096033 TaxID=3366071 RepID=UPI0037F15407